MVAPVRWATPGTDVICATKPFSSPMSTIQSARTPPPSPPMARTAMRIERGVSAPVIVVSSRCRGRGGPGQAALQEADDGPAQPRLQVVPPRRVVDDRGLVERGAQHGRVADLAAEPAADARVDDLRDRVLAE